MIKRTMLWVALSAALIGPAAGASAAPQLNYFRIIGAYYLNGPDLLQVYGQVTEDLAGGPGSANAAVYLTTATGSDSGSGTLEVTLDPTGSVGALSGTIAGQYGPITIDATYISTAIATNLPPNFFVFKTPGQPVLNANYGWARYGELPTATVTSGVGPIDASGAEANIYISLYGVAP